MNPEIYHGMALAAFMFVAVLVITKAGRVLSATWEDFREEIKQEGRDIGFRDGLRQARRGHGEAMKNTVESWLNARGITGERLDWGRAEQDAHTYVLAALQAAWMDGAKEGRSGGVSAAS